LLICTFFYFIFVVDGDERVALPPASFFLFGRWKKERGEVRVERSGSDVDNCR